MSRLVGSGVVRAIHGVALVLAPCTHWQSGQLWKSLPETRG